MADLTAASVTVTCNPADRSQVGKWRMNFVTIQFGNGTDTVPSGGGIPLPALAMFGLNKEMKALIVFGGKGQYEFSFDKANHKLIVYHGDYSASTDGPHTDAGGVAIAARTLNALAIGN